MKPFYRFSRALLAAVLHTGGIRVWGREHIPQNQPLLIICNHVSFGDPPALSVAFPQQITFVAKETFGRTAWTRALFGALGAVFLNREDNDLAALRAVMGELKAGHTVAIFPEGGRHFDQVLSDFQPGAAFIAARTGVRVLPVSVINTGDFWRVWKRNIVVNIGEPLPPWQPARADKETLAGQTALYRQEISRLLEQSRQTLLKEGRKMRRHN